MTSAELPMRTMDCMDCHNRPAHKFQSPESAVNLAMSLGQIDPAPALHQDQRRGRLVPRLHQTRPAPCKASPPPWPTTIPNDPRIRPAIAAVQQIYTDNFFPEMKADWRAYPDNIGHKDWPGCFRCHDGKHVSTAGKRTIKANDCNACHLILAQGSGDQINQLSPQRPEVCASD